MRATYHYTAVYEGTRSGDQYQKVWSRAFDGIANPAFTTFDSVSLASFERLIDAIDSEVEDESAVSRS